MNFNRRMTVHIRRLYSHLFLFSFLFILIFPSLLISSQLSYSIPTKLILSIILSLALVVVLLILESIIRYFAYIMENKASYRYLKEFANKHNLQYAHKLFSPDPRTAIVYGTYDDRHIELGYFVVFPYNPVHSSYFSLYAPTYDLRISLHKIHSFNVSHFFGIEKILLLDENLCRQFHITTNDRTKTKKIIDTTLVNKIMSYSQKFGLSRIEIKEDKLYIENNSRIDNQECLEDTLDLLKNISEHLS